MFEFHNDDLSIHCTRGDAISFILPREHQMSAGDIVRFQVFKKKDCAEVVLRKDFAIEIATGTIEITLSGADTKIGDVINKPTDYWYEVEVNPGEASNTIVGYDEEGAKLFRLYPEGSDDILSYDEYENSAYTIAVEQGFKGTKEEWLASLKGDKGDTGNSGVYVGSGDMPPDCNVQIDPNGETVEVYSKTDIDNMVGDIESALDSIIALQNKLIGGDGV